MEKRLGHRIYSSLLALLVVFSSLSFTIDKHFCGDYLIDTAIFSEAKKCNMDHSDTSEPETQPKGCCKDEIEVVQGVEIVKPSDFDDLDPINQLVVTCFLEAFYGLYVSDSEPNIPHKHYISHIPIRDVVILNQVFLI